VRGSNGEMRAEYIGKMAPKLFTSFPPLNIFLGLLFRGLCFLAQ